MKQFIDKLTHLKLPDPMVLIFYILLIAFVMTHLVPSGEFERTVSDSGQTIVVAGSYHQIEQHGAHIFDIFTAIPRGLISAGPYLFIVFIAGGLFHILQKTHALENVIASSVYKLGFERRNVVVWVAVFVYGFFGVAVGFENNIALVPVAALVAHAIGAGNLVGACIAVGGIGIGFALSPINPYTVGVAQGIAELETFSGWWLRTLLLLVSLCALVWYITKKVMPLDAANEATEDHEFALSKPLEEYEVSKQDKIVLSIFIVGLILMLFGVFTRGWYINEIAGIFIVIAIAIAFATRMGSQRFIDEMMEGAAAVTPGALVIGLAASIQVLLVDAKVIDTLVNSLNDMFQTIPLWISGVLMSVAQGVINLFIPGGSGQALVTMPILVPLADLIGMSRQLMVLVFQVGDGLTNLIVPTSGGTLAMLALARVSYADWLKVIMPLMAALYVLAWGAIILGQVVGY